VAQEEGLGRAEFPQDEGPGQGKGLGPKLGPEVGGWGSGKAPATP
jgi:hypothetical protein